MKNRLFCALAVTAIFCAISGCNVTLGPKIGEEIVIMYPGMPVIVIENRKLKCQTLTGTATVEQDLGGWVAMPREHFEALKRAAEGCGDESPDEGQQVLHGLRIDPTHDARRARF